MKYFNVCSKRTYKTKSGEEKTVWPQIGTLKQMDNGKMFLELNMLPNTPFYCFEPKPKEEQNEFNS